VTVQRPVILSATARQALIHVGAKSAMRHLIHAALLPVAIMRTGKLVRLTQIVNGLEKAKTLPVRIYKFLSLKSALMELIMT
jgi:hypothetical protein